LAYFAHGRLQALTGLRRLRATVGHSAVEQLLRIAHHSAQIVDKLILLV
jgi:hypothetical protein